MEKTYIVTTRLLDEFEVVADEWKWINRSKAGECGVLFFTADGKCVDVFTNCPKSITIKKRAQEDIQHSR